MRDRSSIRPNPGPKPQPPTGGLQAAPHNREERPPSPHALPWPYMPQHGPRLTWGSALRFLPATRRHTLAPMSQVRDPGSVSGSHFCTPMPTRPGVSPPMSRVRRPSSPSSRPQLTRLPLPPAPQFRESPEGPTCKPPPSPRCSEPERGTGLMPLLPTPAHPCLGAGPSHPYEPKLTAPTQAPRPLKHGPCLNWHPSLN